MKGSNEKVSAWEGIKSACQRRIRENARAIAHCGDDDLLGVLSRIQKDDFARLKAANEWLAYFRA